MILAFDLSRPLSQKLLTLSYNRGFSDNIATVSYSSLSNLQLNWVVSQRHISPPVKGVVRDLTSTDSLSPDRAQKLLSGTPDPIVRTTDRLEAILHLALVPVLAKVIPARAHHSHSAIAGGLLGTDSVNRGFLICWGDLTAPTFLILCIQRDYIAHDSPAVHELKFNWYPACCNN